MFELFKHLPKDMAAATGPQRVTFLHSTLYDVKQEHLRKRLPLSALKPLQSEQKYTLIPQHTDMILFSSHTTDSNC